MPYTTHLLFACGSSDLMTSNVIRFGCPSKRPKQGQSANGGFEDTGLIYCLLGEPAFLSDNIKNARGSSALLCKPINYFGNPSREGGRGGVSPGIAIHVFAVIDTMPSCQVYHGVPVTLTLGSVSHCFFFNLFGLKCSEAQGTDQSAG